MSAAKLRERIVRRFEVSVRRRGYSRTVAAVSVACAALSSLLTSILLLSVGLADMGARYLVCVIVSYLVFLAVLRLLVSRSGDAIDLLPDTWPNMGGGGEPVPYDGGGECGGAGASGEWAQPAGEASLSTAGTAAESGSAAASSLSGVDLDDGLLIVVPAAMLLGGIVAAIYVIVIAPVLVAEIALDIAIASSAYRRMNRSHIQHWAGGAFRRTWTAATLLAIFVGIGGSVLQEIVPDARTIGDVLAAIG